MDGQTNRHTDKKSDNKIREKAKQKRHTEALIRTLFDISSAVNTTHDLNELYQIIYNSLNRLMKLQFQDTTAVYRAEVRHCSEHRYGLMFVETPDLEDAARESTAMSEIVTAVGDNNPRLA